MKQSRKKLLTLAGVILLALAIWRVSGLLTPDRALPPVALEAPDYYIENVTITSMDSSGERRYLLKAKQLAHYPDTGVSELKLPELTQYDTAGGPVVTSADHGELTSDKSRILMKGRVKMMRKQIDGAVDVITSNELTVELDQSKKREADE
ncbi:MAG: LPS export ABC transporter periplasmic protein LptC [Gammaproteobacteria bacterium]|nr:LPS export ABC transporter periplasmic protein LptC [Gammaproteobacteria bacterium]